MKGEWENPQEEPELSEELGEIETELSEETVVASSIEESKKKKKSVYVPKLQTMDKFLMTHYKDYILQEINKRLVSGELSGITNSKIVSERIEPGDCCFRRYDFWRLNMTDLLIQVEVRIHYDVEVDGFTDADTDWFYVQLWFSFAFDDIQCEFEEMGLLGYKPDLSEHIKLDKNLVPVLRRDEIEKYAEELWLDVCPEGYRDPRLRTAYNLMGKMGLDVMRVKMHRQPTISATLFFEKGQVLAEPQSECGVHALGAPEEIAVPKNTIVINTASRRQPFEELRIFHECIHYNWHYMFYRLQEMRSTDTRQLKTVRVTEGTGDYKNALSFMESQAHLGSYALMMPATFMRKTINQMLGEGKEVRRANSHFNHIGWRLESIARGLVSAYDFKKALVRARMLQLGYVAARGILNYVDGRYIYPFAFSTNSDASIHETYVIGRKEIAHLYETDKEFRKLIDTGLFAHVDGHVVYADLRRGCDE